MIFRLFAFVSLAALAACAGGRPERPTGPSASAASRAVAPEALLFLDFDADHDRRIDKGELQRGIDASWTELAKGAATVSQIELRDWLDRVLGTDEFDFSPVFFDENLDGRISKAEFASALTRRFTTLDRDNDGVLTRAELSRRVQGGARGGGERQGGMGREGGAGRGGQGRGEGRGQDGGGR
ncbi:MAG TPA: EF-hand domain-containing protein [Caulobacterales bacterium]|nr:EF-hand domain-containing protein [Caulobacterales bacterium]